MNLFTALKHDMAAAVAHIPANWQAIIHGKIAEANLAMPEAPGDVKRSFVVDAIHALTGAAKGFLHGVVHLLVESLEAKTPEVLKPVLSSVEAAADEALDPLVDGLTKRVTQPFKQSPPPETPGKPVTALQAVLKAPGSLRPTAPA